MSDYRRFFEPESKHDPEHIKYVQGLIRKIRKLEAENKATQSQLDAIKEYIRWCREENHGELNEVREL